MAGVVTWHVGTVILEVEGTADARPLEITDLAAPDLVCQGEFEQLGVGLGAGGDMKSEE